MGGAIDVLSEQDFALDEYLLDKTPRPVPHTFMRVLA
jgi:hypothetical protein